MKNMIYYDMFREVPQEAQKPIPGGRLKGMTDINPMWRIKALTEAFGPVGLGWYYKITDKHIEKFGNEASAFVDVELFVKVDGEWSMPIVGTGGSSFVTIERSGNAYMSDECYKMALTDAISIAFKALGGAGNIYFAKDRTKYDVETDADKEQGDKKISVRDIETLAKQANIEIQFIIDSYNEKNKKAIDKLQFMPQENKLHVYNWLQGKVKK